MQFQTKGTNKNLLNALLWWFRSTKLLLRYSSHFIFLRALLQVSADLLVRFLFNVGPHTLVHS